MNHAFFRLGFNLGAVRWYFKDLCKGSSVKSDQVYFSVGNILSTQSLHLVLESCGLSLKKERRQISLRSLIFIKLGY